MNGAKRILTVLANQIQFFPMLACLPIIILLMMICALPMAAQSPGERADFLIIEIPTKLLMYNKYEQQISFREQRALLQPFQPLRIEENDVLLSDSFTKAMKVASGRNSYFLLKTDDGDFENAAEAGYINTLQNCIIINDTVEVFQDNAIFLSKRPTSRSTAESQKSFLKKQTQFLRLFTHKNFTYIQTLETRPAFGWSLLSNRSHGTSWQKLSEESLQKDSGTDLTEIAAKTERRLSEVNSILGKLFGHFNQESNQQHRAPEWEVTVSDQKITCILKNADYRKEFGESTRYIINSLENFVLGTSYGVFQQNDAIEIRKR